MIIMGVDVETTGLNKDEDQIIEMGVILYETVSERIIASFGKIYKVDGCSEGAYKCHLISDELSNQMPHINEDGLDPWEMISGDLAKYIVAHNAAHDYAFVTKRWPSFKNKPWLCTLKDLKHSEVLGRVSSRRLAHLCADYKIRMGSWHQAVADAEACVHIAAKHDLDLAYERKMAPKFKLIAYGEYLSDVKNIMGEAPSVKIDGRRYKWNTTDAPKAWAKYDLTLEEVELDAKHIKDATKGKWKFEGAPMKPKPY